MYFINEFFFCSKEQRAYITCLKESFEELTDAEQYQQIHHEYAGLARLEQDYEDDSDYSLSKQITSYVELQLVSKLAVKKVSKKRNINQESEIRKLILEFQKMKKEIQNTKRRRNRKKLAKKYKPRFTKIQKEVVKIVSDAIFYTSPSLACRPRGIMSSLVSLHEVSDMTRAVLNSDSILNFDLEIRSDFDKNWISFDITVRRIFEVGSDYSKINIAMDTKNLLPKIHNYGVSHKHSASNKFARYYCSNLY